MAAIDTETRKLLIRHLGDALYGVGGENERGHSRGYLESHLKNLIGGYPKGERDAEDYVIKTVWNNYDKKKATFSTQIQKEHELENAGKPFQQWAGVFEFRWLGKRDWPSRRFLVDALNRARKDGVTRQFLHDLVDAAYRPKGGY